MKKIFALLWLVSFNAILAQNTNNTTPFSTFEYGAYAGINFESISEIGGAFFIEINTNLISDLKLKLSLGYSRSYMPTSYTVQTYSTIKIDTSIFYQAAKYDVSRKEYDVFPISLGLKSIFDNEFFSPYLLFDFNYNMIDTKIGRSAGYYWTYNTFDELPVEYRIEYDEVLPDNSIGIAFGFGAMYHISAHIAFDFRYFYKNDNKILDTHQIVAGISL